MIHCPQWTRLLEHRFDPQVEEPEDWSASLEHLEGCEACRVEAYGADPTLVLLDLPTVEVSADEIRRVQQAVMTLRQGLAIAEQDSHSEVATASGRRHLWKMSQWRVAAAVALTAALGLAGLGGGDLFETSGDRSLAPEVRIHRTSPAPKTSDAGVVPAAWQAAPIVEEVGSPAARVYSYPQVEADTMTLVMIIDPEIEV